MVECHRMCFGNIFTVWEASYIMLQMLWIPILSLTLFI